MSALLAPHAAREDLITLAAFVGEAARIPAIVSEPMIGEIRLQWWRDAIEAAQSDSLTGNPVADAVTGLIRRRGLPMDLFTHVLDARLTDLYADPVPDEATFVAYLEATQRTGFDLAARILGVANSTASEKVLMAAGASLWPSPRPARASHAPGAQQEPISGGASGLESDHGRHSRRLRGAGEGAA